MQSHPSPSHHSQDSPAKSKADPPLDGPDASESPAEPSSAKAIADPAMAGTDGDLLDSEATLNKQKLWIQRQELMIPMN